MKKLNFFSIAMIVLISIVSLNTYGQDAEYQPMYLTVTTTHWNDDPDVNFDKWLDDEKEYHEKVVMKNDLIASSGVFMHYMTEDNTEVILVTVYKSWEDIEKSNEVTAKLIEEAWPNEDERKAYFDRKTSYYSAEHSDEIYQTMPYVINPDLPKDKSMIYYVRRSDLALDGQGSSKHFKEYFENITKKNNVAKGYYAHRHLWGSNAREFVEAYVFESLGEIEDYFKRTNELVQEHWADEDERKAFFKEFNKLFTGKHGDYIYRNVPELVK